MREKWEAYSGHKLIDGDYLVGEERSGELGKLECRLVRVNEGPAEKKSQVTMGDTKQ